MNEVKVCSFCRKQISAGQTTITDKDLEVHFMCWPEHKLVTIKKLYPNIAESFYKHVDLREVRSTSKYKYVLIEDKEDENYVWHGFNSEEDLYTHVRESFDAVAARPVLAILDGVIHEVVVTINFKKRETP